MLSRAEPLLKGSWLRKRALAEAMRLVHHEVRLLMPDHACDARFVSHGSVHMSNGVVPMCKQDLTGRLAQSMAPCPDVACGFLCDSRTAWRRCGETLASAMHPNPNPDALHCEQDEDTRYVCIGPVNKSINMLACWFEDPDGDAFKRCGAEHTRRACCKVLPCMISGDPKIGL